jgi:hypothetical protein
MKVETPLRYYRPSELKLKKKKQKKNVAGWHIQILVIL